MVLDAVFLDQRNEIAGRVARKRGFAEVRICRKKVGGVRMNISEVAAAAAGDRDLLADSIGVLQDQNLASAFACFNRAKQTRSATADDNDICV